MDPLESAMTLSAGTRLGPYEILGQIGAGGMGEVYRARDTRLGRDVAVKVLPGEVSHTPERLHRFEQEARLAGSLTTPTSSTSSTSARTRAPLIS
jgi:serine/threonine protein kinase